MDRDDSADVKQPKLATVIPFPERRIMYLGRLGSPDAKPLPPGVRVLAMTVTSRRTGEVIGHWEFD